MATKILNELIQKGVVLDDDRLKQGKTAFGKDDFSELLKRVRSISASERRNWQQIIDIYAEYSFKSIIKQIVRRFYLKTTTDT